MANQFQSLILRSEYGSLLILLTMEKFPNDIRLCIARGTGKGAWMIGQVPDILKEEVEARKASKSSTVCTMKQTAPPNRHSPNHTASFLVASNYGPLRVLKWRAFFCLLCCGCLCSQSEGDLVEIRQMLQLSQDLTQTKGL